MTKDRGLFISFEGGEGSGKTTLIEGLFKALQEKGYQVLKSREPGGTALGEKVRELLLHDPSVKISPMSELLLFLTSRAQHIEEVLKPHLGQGGIILCDRFNDSTIAYQGVARGIGKEETQKLCELACQGITPTITFILDLDPSKGMGRIQKMDKEWDRLEEQKLAFHQKVYEGYHILSNEEPGRIHLIDATQSIEEVFAEAWGILAKKLKK